MLGKMAREPPALCAWVAKVASERALLSSETNSEHDLLEVLLIFLWWNFASR